MSPDKFSLTGVLLLEQEFSKKAKNVCLRIDIVTLIILFQAKCIYLLNLSVK